MSDEVIKVLLDQILYHVKRFEITNITDILEKILKTSDVKNRRMIEDALAAAEMCDYDEVKNCIEKCIDMYN